mmetsp:Transcript_21436/g.36362  ORF Transcript_21436/g.36362 Transcript_21436/m.36362 type:complete len:298 (-) Transcript_21436:448-1341(-)
MTMLKRVPIFLASFILLNSYLALAFNANIGHRSVVGSVSKSAIRMSSTAAAPNSEQKSHLYVPSERDEYYQGNIAQYLLDLHDEGATLNFCGGMMFQLVLSDKLQTHLKSVAADSSSEGKQKQPIIHPASQSLMSRTPDYKKSSFADNIFSFHGRELRKIPTANGGMGFVLQLSYADPSATLEEVSSSSTAGKGADAAWNGSPVDPQGWSKEEIATYDGWRSDQFRQWRKCSMYEDEGYSTFGQEFGNEAFGLNHRFFLHLDNQSRMWLSAEDGCEGTPADDGSSLMKKLGGMLFGR